VSIFFISILETIHYNCRGGSDAKPPLAGSE
jgi:hypothetical protein